MTRLGLEGGSTRDFQETNGFHLSEAILSLVSPTPETRQAARKTPMFTRDEAPVLNPF